MQPHAAHCPELTVQVLPQMGVSLLGLQPGLNLFDILLMKSTQSRPLPQLELRNQGPSLHVGDLRLWVCGWLWPLHSRHLGWVGVGP